MRGGSFLDTNILVYFAVRKSEKYTRAAEILEIRGAISVQVLNEFANVARSKMKLEWEEITQTLEFIGSLVDIHPLTVATSKRAMALAERYHLHIYDAMIVAAALEAGCDTHYSEDMQHGQVIEGRLRIANPFA